MKARLLATVACGLALPSISGCTPTEVARDRDARGTPPASGVAAVVPASDEAPVDSPSARMLEIARTYESWGRVDDQSRVVPELCAALVLPRLSQLRLSSADIGDGGDASAHGKKVYYIFARDKDAYLKLEPGDGVAVGQAVVKESWVAEEVIDCKRGESSSAFPESETVPVTPPPGSVVQSGGRTYRAGDRSGLFILLREKPSADNDEGWVYGTVSADRKTVTSVGRVESCVRCHSLAQHERLYGLRR